MRTYATLSIYASKEIALDEALAQVSSQPTSRTVRNGKFAAHYSSADAVSASTVGEHIQYLAGLLVGLRAPNNESIATISVWIFAELEEPNAGLDFPREMLAWLVALNADIFVDVWK